MNDLKIVKQILSKHFSLADNPTYIFGSRANNTHRPNSDLDILIDDKNIAPETVTKVNEDFEESSLTYKVDIVLKSRIDKRFYNNIQSSIVSIEDLQLGKN